METQNAVVDRKVGGQLARLDDFEKAVYGRKREDRLPENQAAMEALLQCLRALREGAGFEGYAEGLTPSLIARMAAAITTLFLDRGFRLTQEGFNQFCAERSVVDTIFQGSVHGNSDYIFGLVPPDAEHYNNFLLLFSTNSDLGLDLKQVFELEPQATVGLWLSMIGYGHVFTPAADARREKLLELAPLFENCQIPPHLFNAFTGAYMHCSYAHGRDKHAIKRVLHKMVRNTVGIEEPQFGPQIRKERPTILILHEWWHRRHAMYRSYAQSIRQLRKDFRLVAMCPGKNTDDEAKSLFDEWIELDGETMILTEVAERMKKVNADIIYYPSIGMAVWVLAMASFRLAPIQVMTYGHPATSNSPVIDYGIIEEDTFVADRFSERVLPLPANVVRPTEMQQVSARHTPRRSDVIRIGVTAMQVKVTWPFVRALQEVQKRTGKRLEIWFFSAVHGIGLFSFCRHLTKHLEGVTVQEMQQYPDYMESLSKCDLALFSFPFGGTNSTIDALILGLPMVSMLGTEPHAMSDAALIRRAGLPEELIATTEEAYIAKIVKLCDDDDYRGEIAEKVRAVDVQQKFFTPDDSGAFLEAFRTIYRNNTVEQAA